MSSRLAIDIGGTFTDATLIDEETGAVSIAKVLSTPSDPSLGFMAASAARSRAGRGSPRSSRTRRARSSPR